MSNSKVENALKVIQNLDPATLELGKHVVDDDFYYIVQEYVTKDPSQGRHEAHKKYIDIQYVVEGEERIDVTAASFMTVDEPYSEEKDVVLFVEPKQASQVILRDGEYAIFYPKDSHKPGLSAGSPCKVKKIVGKVLL